MRGMRFKINTTGSEFKETSFEDLKEKLILDSPEAKKEEIKENLKKNELEFPSIIHLYLEITRKANSLLVNHEKCRSDLEKGYSNILKLISNTLNIKTIQPKDKDGNIDDTKRDRLVRSLWENRNQLNETMSHYVRQIQNLREKNYKRITIYLSSIAISISIFFPIILKICYP